MAFLFLLPLAYLQVLFAVDSVDLLVIDLLTVSLHHCVNAAIPEPSPRVRDLDNLRSHLRLVLPSALMPSRRSGDADLAGSFAFADSHLAKSSYCFSTLRGGQYFFESAFL